jgi:NAD(P)-dependent dehydrogenase (short-subunit alcohol dehydrogenase family)
MVSLNFNTAYTIAQAVFGEMIKQKRGRIIFVGARPALLADQGKNAIAYGLSKTMVMKLAEYLNAEGAEHNVLSHVIVPSTIDTPANRNAMPTADFSSWVRPEDIVDTMLFLCSDTSSAFRDTVIKMYSRS